MHRRALLAALAQRAGADPAEAEALASMCRFVATQPDCFRRELAIGHVTGSAWVVDAARQRVLLTQHRKLNRWLQLGGHADGDPDVARVAVREAREESGLDNVVLVSPVIFDVDVHRIPARGHEPEHLHYDVRYLCEADPRAKLSVSDESHALAWIELGRVHDLDTDGSVLRMVGKSMRLGARD